MYFSAGGNKQGEDGYKDFFGDGSEKFYFPMQGSGSEILNRQRIYTNYNYDRYNVVDGKMCLEFRATDSNNNYAYTNNNIPRSTWEATSITARVRIDAANDGRWVNIFGIGYWDLRNGSRQPGLWVFPDDKTKLHCRNDSEDKDNDGADSESGAIPHEEWFDLTVSIEPLRMRVWVGRDKIIDYVPLKPFRKYDRQLILGAGYSYGGVSMFDIRIFNRGMTQKDVDFIDRKFKKDFLPFEADSRYETLEDNRTLRAYPFKDSIQDMITGENINAVGGTNQAQLYSGQLHVGHDQFQIENLPVDEDTEAITLSGMLYPTASGMMFGMYSHSIYQYNSGFGFNTGASDCYGIPLTIVQHRWSHISITFKKGKYGDIFVNGIRQTLQHFATVPDAVDPQLVDRIAFSGWLGDASYRYAGWYKKLKVIKGELTDAEAMLLATEEWPTDRSIDGFPKGGGLFVHCEDEPEEACIAMATRVGATSFRPEHLIAPVKVTPYSAEKGKRRLWERMEALKNEAQDGALRYSLDIDNLPSSQKEMYNGETALIMSEANVIDTGVEQVDFKSVHMRAYYDGVSIVGVGNTVNNRLHIRTRGESMYIQWREGAGGVWNYSSYAIPTELLNTWVDFIVSVNARGIQFDRVTANGKNLPHSLETDSDGTLSSKTFAGTAKIGASLYNSEVIYSDGRLSKLDIYSSYLGQKNIDNIIAGKTYNDGLKKYSKEETIIERVGQDLYGIYKGATVMGMDHENDDFWFHKSIPGVIETSHIFVGIQKPRFEGFIKREVGSSFGENSYYARATSNDILGSFMDRLSHPYWHGIYKTVGGLPVSAKVRVVVHMLCVDSLDQAQNDRFIVEAGSKQLRISPSTTMINQVASLDALIAVQPTIIKMEGVWQHSGLGETMASFMFDVDTNASGQVYVRVRGYTNQSYNDESFGLVAADFYELPQE